MHEDWIKVGKEIQKLLLEIRPIEQKMVEVLLDAGISTEDAIKMELEFMKLYVTKSEKRMQDILQTLEGK
jgi:hypothetical protein